MTNSSDFWRVVVCDDQPHIRLALKEALANLPGYEIVGEAEDGTSCIASALESKPDLLILDVGMPQGGVDLVRTLLSAQPELAIVIFTAHRDDLIMNEMLDAGAREYVVKTGRLQPLVQALNRVSGLG